MKQFMRELDSLEKAIALERDSQLRKMRQRLIKRKIEQEKLKKDEAQAARVQALKKQIGKYLLQAIQQARTKIMQEKASKIIKHIITKPGSSAGKRPMIPIKASKQERVVDTKDLRLLLE